MIFWCCSTAIKGGNTIGSERPDLLHRVEKPGSHCVASSGGGGQGVGHGAAGRAELARSAKAWPGVASPCSAVTPAMVILFFNFLVNL